MKKFKACRLLVDRDLFTIFRQWVLGTHWIQYQWVQLPTCESELFFIANPENLCILGPTKITTLHNRDQIMSIGCRMHVGKKITVLVDYGGYTCNYDIYKSSSGLLLH